MKNQNDRDSATDFPEGLRGENHCFGSSPWSWTGFTFKLNIIMSHTITGNSTLWEMLVFPPSLEPFYMWFRLILEERTSLNWRYVVCFHSETSGKWLSPRFSVNVILYRSAVLPSGIFRNVSRQRKPIQEHLAFCMSDGYHKWPSVVSDLCWGNGEIVLAKTMNHINTSVVTIYPNLIFLRFISKNFT